MNKQQTEKSTVIVIGAGLGGLSAAITLAQNNPNLKITIIEKNSHLGGKLNQLTKEGFRFDLGPSIFTLPQYFKPLFAPKNMSDYFKLEEVKPQWRNFFEDHAPIDLYQHEADMEKELAKLSHNPAKSASNKNDVYSQYQDFMKYSKEQFEIIDRGYFRQGLDTFWDFMKFYGLLGANKLDFHHTMSQGISKRIHHKQLAMVFEYFIKYVGSSANDSPGFMNLMPYIQVGYGLWYVKGGLFQLSEALRRRCQELNIEIRLQTEVVQIHKTKNTVSGVSIKQSNAVTQLSADYIVSNMEIIPAHQKILNDGNYAEKKLSRLEPACSGLVLHLGVKGYYSQLAHHNFFYSKDQTHHFDVVFKERRLPPDPTIYLVAPSRTDPTCAPDGYDNLKILPHIPYLEEKPRYSLEDYRIFKDQVIDKLERMGLKDLRKNIVVEDYLTPFDIEKMYYSNRGSIYGVVSDRNKNFAFKAPKKSALYKNLYFVGGSINPGGGMPMVVLSGQLAAKKLLEEMH